MYRITLQMEYGAGATAVEIYNDAIERGLSPATNIVWNQSTTTIDSLEFDIYDQTTYSQALVDAITLLAQKPFYSTIALRTTEVASGVPVFSGRATSCSPQMDADGTPYLHVVAEHDEGHLNDCQIDNSEYIKTYCGDDDIYEGGKWRVDCEHYITWVLEHYYNVINSIASEVPSVSNVVHACYPADITLITGDYAYITQQVATPHDMLIELFEERAGEWRFRNMINHDYLTTYGQPPFGTIPDTTDKYVLVLDYIDTFFNITTAGSFQIGVNVASATYEANYNNLRTVVYPVGDEYETEYTNATGTKTFQQAIGLQEYYENASVESLQRISELGWDISNNLDYYFYQAGLDAYGVVSERYQITGYSSKDEVQVPGTEDTETVITVSEEQADAFYAELYNHLREVMRLEDSYDIVAYDLSKADNAPAGTYTPFRPYEWWIPDMGELLHRGDIPERKEVCGVTTYIQEPHKSRVQLSKPRKNSLRVLAKAAKQADSTAQKVEKLETEKLSREPATTTNLGGIKTDGTTVKTSPSGVLSVRPASSTNLGGVKADGFSTMVDTDGTLRVGAATSSHIGGVKADGTTTTVDNDGTIHAVSDAKITTCKLILRALYKSGGGTGAACIPDGHLTNCVNIWAKTSQIKSQCGITGTASWPHDLISMGRDPTPLPTQDMIIYGSGSAEAVKFTIHDTDDTNTKLQDLDEVLITFFVDAIGISSQATQPIVHYGKITNTNGDIEWIY